MVLRRPSLNIPNQLTLMRLGLCGVFLVTMSLPWPYAATTALLIFTVASLTDWLDGALARKYGWITDLGKLLDPLADKILILGALISLVERQVAPMWMVVVIMAREFLISGLRQVAAKKQKILAAERVGKHKTISQIIVILVSLGYLSLGEFGLQTTMFARTLLAAELPLYWFALIITVVSGAIYFYNNASLLDEKLESAPLPLSQPTVPAAEPEVVKSFPAFKEWAAIVEALGQGAQMVILRKGGIAEGRSGFQAKYPQFWLFPTQYHQQWEKTRPELQKIVVRPAVAAPRADAAQADFILQYVAEVTDELYLESWEKVERLADVHFWSEEILRERFSYQDRPGMKAGLHLLIVRVSQMRLPHHLKLDKAYEGCKSWIEVPVGWDTLTPVVPAEEFATRRSRILAAVKTSTQVTV